MVRRSRVRNFELRLVWVGVGESVTSHLESKFSAVQRILLLKNVSSTRSCADWDMCCLFLTICCFPCRIYSGGSREVTNPFPGRGVGRKLRNVWVLLVQLAFEDRDRVIPTGWRRCEIRLLTDVTGTLVSFYPDSLNECLENFSNKSQLNGGEASVLNTDATLQTPLPCGQAFESTALVEDPNCPPD
ncbi:hypothetical protein T265_06244 [Opisthorchis viverrini]|uniref:Uncharacterized protein n=1 Tax=Opisthorchis viverrini TaxID=6198 RepID=A0A075AE64_OPIVI|nr:hypothetical protein T265_06244 [Opisthorchis viverrini]KER26524.1 hypothetical protein T265_06244 [Opisthorchis viverrini]